MNDNKKKYGIMGGTFDPIHLGHLFIAESALNELGLDKIVFIPAGVPPHKQNQNISCGLDRYLMTALAINSNERFVISPIEIKSDEPSYTINTISAILQVEDAEIFFITGADTFITLDTWKDFKSLFQLINIVVVSRPGFNNEELNAKIRFFSGEFGARIINLSVPSLEISSTDIRNRVSSGKTIKYLVPENVEQFIYKNRLYLHNN